MNFTELIDGLRGSLMPELADKIEQILSSDEAATAFKARHDLLRDDCMRYIYSRLDLGQRIEFDKEDEDLISLTLNVNTTDGGYERYTIMFALERLNAKDVIISTFDDLNKVYVRNMHSFRVDQLVEIAQYLKTYKPKTHGTNI